MSKKSKILTNTILGLLIIISVVAGLFIEGMNCWFETACTSEEAGYWPYIFMYTIPAILIFFILFISIRNRNNN